jgi:hypothetical protein
MQDNQNKDNKDVKADANKSASERMSQNDDTQNEAYRQNQNKVTQSTGTEEQNDALSNNHKNTNDSLSAEEINKRKLESERDADFGNEQLQ